MSRPLELVDAAQIDRVVATLDEMAETKTREAATLAAQGAKLASTVNLTEARCYKLAAGILADVPRLKVGT